MITRTLQVLLASLALLAPAVGAVAQELEIIELRYRLAEEMIPVLQPLVAPGGVITGADRMLFVRTTPANIGQLREAVAMLDRRPRQVSVSVGQGTVAETRGAGLRGAVSIDGGDVQAGVNAPPGTGSGVAVGARGGARQDSLGNVSTVRTLEGSETWIAVGQVVPLSGVQPVKGPRGPRGEPYVEYREVSTGFYATARLSGDLVTLEISPHQQRLQGNDRVPTVATAGSTTTVSGRLGEWMPLGAVREAASGSGTGLLVWGRYRAESEYSAWVRVDEVP